jgi:3-hydroxybutyryl-CoA dehydratase
MNQLGGLDVEDIEVGMQASFAKTISEADIVLFAAASGDNNAIHINDEFARSTAFGGRIAHGMLSASVISAAIANKLPGPGTVYMGQNLRFVAPVRPGDTVQATIKVAQVRPDKAVVHLDTVCKVGDMLVITGQAVVKVTRRQGAQH